MAKSNLKADTFRNEGNSLFQQRNFHKALISYNKSLCFSLRNSQQLGFAFANRAAVYLEVDLPDHCLENIQLARDHNYQNEEKLKERENKCLELKKNLRHDPENDPEAFMKLSYPSNKKIPFIVNCLELRENDQYGRYVRHHKPRLESWRRHRNRRILSQDCQHRWKIYEMCLLPQDEHVESYSMRLLFKW